MKTGNTSAPQSKDADSNRDNKSRDKGEHRVTALSSQATAFYKRAAGVREDIRMVANNSRHLMGALSLNP